MKTIAFIFEKKLEYNPQVEWAVKEFIQPGVHQIVFIYLLPENIYMINDPWSMLFCSSVLEKEQANRRKAVKCFLDEVEAKITSQFTKKVQISKIVICGNERYKLNACLSSLYAELVILGPDVRDTGLFKWMYKPLDTYIVENIGITTVRIPSYYKSDIYNK